MADEDDEPRSRGCLARIFGWVVFMGVVAMGTAVFLMIQPQDLSDLEGYGGSAAAPARDLREVLSRSLDGGHEVVISEADLNAYLRATLAGDQGGAAGEVAKFKDVAVRLTKDLAEVIMVREIEGREFTVSMFLRVEQTLRPDGLYDTRILRNGGLYHPELTHPPRGGRFGRLIVPEGFLYLVLPAFSELAAAFQAEGEGQPRREIDLIGEMTRIRIEDGKLRLDPRLPNPSMPEGLR